MEPGVSQDDTGIRVRVFLPSIRFCSSAMLCARIRGFRTPGFYVVHASLWSVCYRRLLPCLASMIPSGNGLCSLSYVLCEEVICGVYSRPTARQLHLIFPNSHNLGTENQCFLLTLLTASMILSSSIIIPHVNHLFSRSSVLGFSVISCI